MNLICKFFGHTKILENERRSMSFFSYLGRVIQPRKIETRKVWRCRRCHKPVIKEPWVKV